MKVFENEDQFHKKLNKNTKKINPSKEQVLSKAFQFHSQGNISEAAKYYQYCINQGFADAKVFSNFGVLLRGLGKLKEAELSTRKAIELNPNYAFAHLNLGGILKDLGNFKEAELSVRKAIELDPNCASAYFSLSTLKYDNESNLWINKLFSKNFLNNKNIQDQINIYFARANILHNDKKYQESSKCLQSANKLKLDIKKSQSENRINKSKILFIETNKREISQKKSTNSPQSIFIVGMPRSGSTLLESILSINSNVDALGETNIFKESFLNWKKPLQKSTLAELYLNKTNTKSNESRTTTNKWLYNYLYAGIISTQIPNCKIIHCFRNPLDNILSIYRAHFRSGNEYASSLKDCANVYLHHEEIINDYIKQNPLIIYKLNYDELVTKPEKQIKLLVNWLGWKWENAYLKPHKNPRSVTTASNVQIRSPINSKSIGGWRNYKNLLKPAIEILIKNEKYLNLID